MRESPIQITLTVHLILSIDPTEQYPLAAVAELITQQSLKSTLLETLIERLNERLVEAYCGEKHAHGNGTKRFQRSATSTRSAVTTTGEHEFTLDYVEDTTSRENESTHFRPIEHLIDFDGKKRYQQDISAQSVDLATTLSYRDAASHGDGFEKMPSPDTIQRRVKEYGTHLTEYVANRFSGTEADTVVPDGTKCYSQDDDRDYHDVQLTLAEDTDEDSRSVWMSRSTLTGMRLLPHWKRWMRSLTTRRSSVILKPVSSRPLPMEHANINLISPTFHEHSATSCGTTAHSRWMSAGRSLRRLQVNCSISRIPSRSIVPKRNVRAIRERIARTKERVEKTAWQLEQLSSPKATEYLRGGLPSILTFAEDALDGFEVPWTSNPVERAMGEIAKRCKRDWMQWSESGLEALLQLRLVKYANPDHYRQFFDDLLRRSTHKKIRCTVSVTATGGEV